MHTRESLCYAIFLVVSLHTILIPHHLYEANLLCVGRKDTITLPFLSIKLSKDFVMQDQVIVIGDSCAE